MTKVRVTSSLAVGMTEVQNEELMASWEIGSSTPCMFALTGTLRQTLQNDGFDVEPQSDISTFIQFNLIILSPGM